MFHGASTALMLVLANGFTIPITAQFAEGHPGAQSTWPTDIVAEPKYAHLTASFLIIVAVFHAVISLPGVFERYAAKLAVGRAPFRWAEYSISSSIMLVPIAMLVGVTDVAAFTALVGVDAAMTWFGYLQEFKGEAGMRLYWLGCLAGAEPWIAIGIYR